MINIANLLKGAPEGMPLYSPLFGNVELSEVRIGNDMPIRIKRGYAVELFDEYGRYYKGFPDAECLLFPSKGRTWEEWKLPKFKMGDWLVYNDGNIFVGGARVVQVQSVEEIDRYIFTQNTNGSCRFIDNHCRLWSIQDAKDGDVLATDNGWTCIFKAFDGCVFSSYCFMDSQKWFCEVGSEAHTLDSRINGNIHPATKEQRDILFTKMKEAGYQWDADKKELRKIQPHYDIANFHAGMPVLVRDDESNDWRYVQFSHVRTMPSFRFVAGAAAWQQCIPFNDDTKHLLGTTDMPSEEFINWQTVEL